MATENERVPLTTGVSQPSTSMGAVFLSYASEDALAAERIASALRSAGIEVWFDKSELRGGDAWDRRIREQIHDCRLFIAVISSHTEARDEGYFRREWRLAVERAGDMAEDKAFVVPVAIDGTSERSARVPDPFKHVQWTRVPDGETSPAFVARLRRLLSPEAPAARLGLARQQLGSAIAATPSRSALSSWGWRPASWAIGAVLVVALAYFLVDKFWISKRTAAATAGAVASSATAPEKSVAVLPFADMSEKHDQGYFADGMAEEIIDRLAKVRDLHVPARTSSFYFKGKSTKIPDIARELGVSHILEGSIRRLGNQIRVTAQLVRADNGYHLWSQTYDRDLNDVFKVQDDIANAVVQALQITLMGGPLTRQAGGTQNLEAYQLVLRAKSAYQQSTKESLKTALEYAERAIKLDPDFALAGIWIGFITIDLAQTRALPLQDAYERARQMAQHALELSPELAEAHLLLAYIHRSYDWDWAAAQAEVRQALAIDPVNSVGLLNAGIVAATLGHWDDAERQMRAALVRDPLSTTIYWHLATTLYRAGRFADAEAAYRKLLELEPDYGWAHGYLAKTLLAQGKPEAALAMAQQEGNEANRLDTLPIVLQAAGRHAEADEALKVLATKYADSDAYCVAMTYAYRDDHDLALRWLERAYQQKEVGFGEIVGEPLFKNLANDPRYKAFLRKMNLPG